MAVEWVLVAMILLLVGVHEAYALTVDGYTYPASQTFTILNKQFTYDRYANPITGVSTRFFCGLNLTNASTASMMNMNSTHFWLDFPLGVATDTHRIDSYQLVSGVDNNFTVEVNNGGATNGYSKIDMILPNGSTATVANINVVGATCFGNLKYTTDINISAINATHYLLNYTQKNYTCASFLVQTNVAHALPINSNISFAFARGGTAPTSAFGMYPHFTCNNEYHPIQIGNWTTPLGFPASAILSFYMSAVNYTTSDAAYVRSDFTTNTYRNMSINANYTPYYMAYLYFGTSIIQPKITYFPSIDAFGDFYNTSNGAAYLMNNTGAYVFDNVSNSWYFCPPLSISTWQTPYVMSCYFASSGGSGVMNMSLMYLIQNCYQNGNNYSWYIKSQAPVSYSAQQIFNNSTVFNYAFTGDTYSGSQQILNMPDGNVTLNFTIYQGSQVICAYTNSTGTFFGASTSVLTGFSITRIAAFIFFLAIVALSMTLPMAIIGAMFINDLFSLLPQSEMFFIAIGATALSFIYNHYGANSLKSVGLYFAIGLVIITHVAGIGQTAGLPGFSDISARINVISNSYSSIVQTFSQADLIGFSVSSVLFIVNIFLFFLSIPSMLVYLIFTPISYISPMLYTATWLFRIVIEIGIYLWIGLKAYEVISKQFPGVV